MNKTKLHNESERGEVPVSSSSGQKEEDKTLRLLIQDFEKYELQTAVLKFSKDGSSELTYRALLRYIQQLSNGLVVHGLVKGQRAVIAAPNSSDWIISCLSVIYSGATVVPVDLHLDDEALNHVILDSDAHWIFTDLEGAKRIRNVCPRRHLKFVILEANDDSRAWQNLLSENPVGEISIVAEDQAILFYTSGTTGMPKGVPLTHANIIMQLDSVIADLEILHDNDRLLIPLPLFHVYPLNIGLFSCFKRGLPAILPDSLTGPELMRAINDGGATMLIAVPRLLRSLYDGIESKMHANKLVGLLFDAALNTCIGVESLIGIRLGKVLFFPLRQKFSPTLKSFTSGGSLLEAELARKLRAIGWDLSVGYGLTETAPLLTIRLPSNSDIESVGPAIPGVELRISPYTPETDEDPVESKSKTLNVAKQQETDAETNSAVKEGQIEARGANIFHGYLNLDDKTEEAFSDDGWFVTGDLGFLKNGNLHITGRASSLLVMEGGKKIQPDDLEDKYGKNPAIKEIGILQYEHKLVALIHPNRGTGDVTKTVSAALNSVSSSLPSHLKIVDFALTNEPLPKTNIGKLKRHELEDKYKEAKSSGKSKQKVKTTPQPIEEMSAEEKELLQNPAASQVWTWLCKRFPERGLSMESSTQFDLNIDSFEWMNLTLDIMQNTGVELQDEAIARIETIKDLLREVIDASSKSSQSSASPFDSPEKFIDEKQARFLKPLSKFELFCTSCIYKLNLWLMSTFFHISQTGFDKLPEDEQLVFIPNHTSYLDIFALGASMPYDRLRKTQVAAWTGIAFANPFNTIMSRLVRAFPIDAKKSLVASLALAVAVLKNGSSLIWFPEGERTLDGKLLTFKPGIGMLLEHQEVKVVPVYLEGTREALPPGAFFPKLCKITVHYGKPTLSSELNPIALGNDKESESASTRIANKLRERVRNLGSSARKAHANDDEGSQQE